MIDPTNDRFPAGQATPHSHGAEAIGLELERFILRDFEPADRAAFVTYQADPRYQNLYRGAAAQSSSPEQLFDLFLDWKNGNPRRNFQLGIFEKGSKRLCGTIGLREQGQEPGVGVIGIELTPVDWGRYRLAIDVFLAMADFAFDTRGLVSLTGSTASGNRRVTRLATLFGATIVDRRPGPDWMTARGWEEVEWRLERSSWTNYRNGAGWRRLFTRPISTM